MNDLFFTPNTLKLLTGLEENNNREWFSSHKAEWENSVMAPARNLVVEVGEKLKALSPGLIADPRVDRSIYRINHDTRFSKEKRPYKEHLALWWWEGELEQRLNCPGLYFHISGRGLILSAGIYAFSAPDLAVYYQSALDDKKGAELARLIDEFKRGGAKFNEPHLKRGPAGFDNKHPRALLLRYKGLYTWDELEPHPPAIFGPGAADFIVNYFKPFLPLHNWLLKVIS